MLHAQLEIWKAAVEESPRNMMSSTTSWNSGILSSPESGNSPVSIITNASSGVNDLCNLDYSDGNYQKI